jgi:hypothetical protein
MFFFAFPLAKVDSSFLRLVALPTEEHRSESDSQYNFFRFTHCSIVAIYCSIQYKIGKINYFYVKSRVLRPACCTARSSLSESYSNTLP